jgi:hypothetical protein
MSCCLIGSWKIQRGTLLHSIVLKIFVEVMSFVEFCNCAFYFVQKCWWFKCVFAVYNGCSIIMLVMTTFTITSASVSVVSE